jgi:TPR repeat protein
LSAEGEGVSKDLEGAAHHYKLAADQGYADAQNNYGLCLHHSHGISKDLKGVV